MNDVILAVEQLLSQLELDIQLSQDRGQHIRAVQRRDSVKHLLTLLKTNTPTNDAGSVD